jgi:hypothetical protein
MFVIIEHPEYLINHLRYDIWLVDDQQKNHAFFLKNRCKRNLHNIAFNSTLIYL